MVERESSTLLYQLSSEFISNQHWIQLNLDVTNYHVTCAMHCFEKAKLCSAKYGFYFFIRWPKHVLPNSGMDDNNEVGKKGLICRKWHSSKPFVTSRKKPLSFKIYFSAHLHMFFCKVPKYSKITHKYIHVLP